ncbi:MAG TPA: alanine racemase [Acidimicrobiales bacterium]|nr:alanine racemase [Acidimicrobiales bacterium]
MTAPPPDLGPPLRPTWVEIDPAAIAANVRAVRAVTAPVPVWAVVKADGYGHGAVTAARAALEGGAEGLAVALVEEGEELRAAGVDARLLLLSEPPPGAEARVVAAGIEPTAYSAAAVEAMARAVAGRGGPGAVGGPWPLHLKVDTGMHRVGAAPGAAPGLARLVADRPELRLASVWTHMAVADEPDSGFTAEQADRFAAACAAVEAAGVPVPVRHAANSAAALAHPATRLDLVRVGIAAYGIAPSPALAGAVDLVPALRLVSRVAHVKVVAAGEAISYGQRYRVAAPTTVATVPVGYADGVRRALGAAGGVVLVGGRRCPIAGTVTMDQITVDCGPRAAVRPGDEVVLIGRQGVAEVTAEEWAERLGTIGYEVTCGIGARVPRRVRPRSATPGEPGP